MTTTRTLLAGAALAALATLLPAHAQAEGEHVALEFDYGISEATDPMVRREIIELRRSGLIDFQGQVGTDLLAIERLQRRAQAIRGLMADLGTEGLRQFDPDLYVAMENSPILLNQRLAEIRLRRDLEAELAADQEEDATPTPGMDDLAAAGRQGPANMFDGPPFTTAWVGEAPPVEAPMDFTTTEEPAEEAPPPIVDFPISLREILGSNGVYRAVILHGQELIRVEVGDMLPNDTEIIEVMMDRLRVRRRDREFDIHLRG